MTSRQEALLASIIKEYIETAEPVSSKLLEEMGFFGLCSATIRAEMNELEELGYLVQLYTSSGRVPTDKAYRFYVDNLNRRNAEGLREEEIRSGYKTKIKTAIYRAGVDPRKINRAVAQTLSDLSENLVITAIEERQDFFKAGLSSLFELPEFHEFDRVFRLTSFFDEFESIFDQLEREFWDEDIKIFIGRENPVRDIKDETVMLARYNLPRHLRGSLTLVGPTRMDYGKNIGLIKFTTEELNKLAKRI